MSITIWDDHANLAYSVVTVGPAPALTGTTLTVNDASSFPTEPFNATIWPTGDCAYLSNAEIVRVTGIVGNVLTIVRAQEGTTAQPIAAGYQFANTITAQVIDDIQDAVNQLEIDMLPLAIMFGGN